MYLCPGNGSLQRRYNNLLLYTEVISKRGSKILGDAPRIFLLHVHCVIRTLQGVCHFLPPPLPICGSASGPYQSKTAATSGCALHIILCTDTFYKCIHAHTETEMYAWMDAHIM